VVEIELEHKKIANPQSPESSWKFSQPSYSSVCFGIRSVVEIDWS
jgi:hypothetical protein